MELVMELARENMDQGTGGPFAAAVFDMPSGNLIAPGVNLVNSLNLSSAHAEVLALMAAQVRIGHYDLSSDPSRRFELVTSTEPCVMCLGAVLWSGVHHLICGARDVDARGIGFDEGPKPSDWVAELKVRRVDVTRDVCREQGIQLLQRYAETGGPIYNPAR